VRSSGRHANWATNDWATKFRVRVRTRVSVRFRNRYFFVAHVSTAKLACRPDDWRAVTSPVDVPQCWASVAAMVLAVELVPKQMCSAVNSTQHKRYKTAKVSSYLYLITICIRIYNRLPKSNRIFVFGRVMKTAICTTLY